MDFQNDYENAKQWHRKVSIMNLFHTQQCMDKTLRWTLRDTALYFGVSIGLVSENIRLAAIIDANPNILKAENRAEALKLADRRKNKRDYFTNEDTD